MHKLIYFQFTVLLILCSFNSSAQDVSLKASAPGAVRAGEQFRITYTSNSKGSFAGPNIPGELSVLMGPSTSYNTSSARINGKRSSVTTYTITYVVQARKEGRIVIPPATINVKRKDYKSSQLTINVVKGNATSNSEKLFVRVHLNKKEVYQGEHIIATVKVYTQLNLTGFEDYQLPDWTGFLKQEIETPPLRQLTQEAYNGDIYNTGVLKKVVLFPQQTGDIDIEPFKAVCVVQQQIQRQSSSPFDSFFGGNVQNSRIEVESPAQKITVKPLPANKPAAFNGGVGKFKMSASVNTTSITANDAVTLKIQYTGNGNLRLIPDPKVNFPTDFDVYDPKVSSNIKSDQNGTYGTKTYEIIFQPRHQGEYTIPPVEFCYFDNKLKQYKTLKSEPFKISVAKGADDDKATIISGFSKEDVKFVGKDIRFIKTNEISLQTKGHIFFGSISFWSIYLLAILIFITIIVVKYKSIKENANVVKVKNKKANKVAKNRLKAASAYQKQDEEEKFYEEIVRVIWGYLSDKLAIPVAELSRDNAIVELKKQSVEQETIEKLTKVIDDSEFARYAPSASSVTTSDVYDSTVLLISKLEQNLK